MKNRKPSARGIATQRAALDEFADGLEPITPSDLRVIRHALTDRIVRFGTFPAGIAAQRVLEKLNRNEGQSMTTAAERQRRYRDRKRGKAPTTLSDNPAHVARRKLRAGQQPTETELEALRAYNAAAARRSRKNRTR